MQQRNEHPRVSLPLMELRGPSGKLYGMLNPTNGIITFKIGKGRDESIDLSPYFKTAKIKTEEYQGS